MVVVLLPCICGCKVELKSRTIQSGQGYCDYDYWAESECGISGKHFNTYNVSHEFAKMSAIGFWNAHFIQDKLEAL